MVETQRIVEWLQRLVPIPSVGPANAGPRSGAIDEGRIAAQAATWLEALGGKVESEDVFPGRPNTYGVWRGQTDRWIAVDVHVDTVGVETMIGDPFDGRLEANSYPTPWTPSIISGGADILVCSASSSGSRSASTALICSSRSYAGKLATA